MQNIAPRDLAKPKIVLSAMVIIVLLLGYFLYDSHKTRAEIDAEKNTLEAALKSELESTRATATATEASLSARIAELEVLLSGTEEEREEALEKLDDEKDRNDEFEDKLSGITKTVGTLDKLSKTDPELLQKYSKVFFLNEHYAPPKLEKIDTAYLTRSTDIEYFHKNVWPKLKKLLDDAKEDGVDISVLSAYRSFDTQKELKSSYTVTYGSGANAFSADQGYSEHQLGTALDFSSTEIGGSLTGFEITKAYAWLQKNAHKYGFVLSYPNNNAYYIFEPWHWRYVGDNLAEDLNEDGKFFYDMDQREIDKYLVNIFD